MNVYISILYNYLKLEITQIYFNEWMSKQTVLHPYKAVLFINKNGWTIAIHNNLNLQSILLSEKSKSPKVTYQMIPLMWHPGKNKYCNREQISGFHGLGVGETFWFKKSTIGKYLACCNHAIIRWKVVTKIYACVKSHRTLCPKQRILLYVCFLKSKILNAWKEIKFDLICAYFFFYHPAWVVGDQPHLIVSSTGL